MCYYGSVEVLKKLYDINCESTFCRKKLERVSFFKGDERMFDYYGSKWKKKRNSILRKDKYKCQIAKWFGRSEEANTVHHIYPAKDYPEYAWCDWNLISVSNKSHNKLENRKTGELTSLGKWLMQKTVPGVGWRKK